MNTGTVERLYRVLDTGDLELHFQDGRSIKAHRLKLKFASLDVPLQPLLDMIRNHSSTSILRHCVGHTS